jgi:hypothetical protein
MRLSRPRVVQEFEGADLGDVRRNARLLKLAEQMALQPAESLPKIAGNAAELEAAYRFFGNAEVKWDAILRPHRRRTAERAVEAGRVVVIHDTTTCQFAHADPQTVGYLNTGKAGFLGHVSLVVSADGARRPLGVGALEPVFRASRSTKGRDKKQSGSDTTKIADRESLRWQRGVVETEALLSTVPERIHVMDREGDSYSLLAHLHGTGCRFVVRAKCDRVARAVDTSDTEAWSKLKTLVSVAQSSLQREVPLSTRRTATAPTSRRSHPTRQERTATLQFAATTLELKRPRYFSESVPEAMRVNLVRVYETDAPQGEEPVEWLLITTEPIDTEADIAAIVDTYRARWVIEEFFKALKSGCLYEQRQLESRNSLLNSLAVSLPIACDILWMRSRAQQTPTAPATDVLTLLQINVLRAIVRRALPEELTARDVLLAVAALGGHLKRNGEPGWSTIRHGFERLLGAELGWVAAKSQRKM